MFDPRRHHEAPVQSPHDRRAPHTSLPQLPGAGQHLKGGIMSRILHRIYRALRIRVFGDPAWMHETLDEMCKRNDEHFARPEVIERMRSIPASFTYERGTGKLTRIERD